MNQSFRNRQFPAGNPIANALMAIAGVLVVVLSFALGLVVFVALGAVLLVTAAIVGIRLWWFNRQLGNHPPQSAVHDDVIEGEFRIVSDSSRSDRHGE